MIQKRFENRATRRNNKKKKNKRFVNLMAISTVTAVIFAYSINGVADNKKVSNKVAVELGVEKIEKDKVKIKLDNFTPVIKSLQLSLKIDGNAKFKENSIEWLVKSKSNDIKTHTKISDDKKSMEIFIISNEPLDKNGGELEICEINVTKDGNGSSAYTINANVNNDGNSYSYIINDTNKQVSGNDIANLNMEKLTINSSPVISLKNLATVVVMGNTTKVRYSNFSNPFEQCSNLRTIKGYSCSYIKRYYDSLSKDQKDQITFEAFEGKLHQWSTEKEVIKEPTCTEEGENVYRCEICGATKKAENRK